MKLLRNMSIRQKLRLLTMGAAGVALLIACLALVVSDRIHQRTVMMRSQSIIADIVGANTVASLVFFDPSTAEETLGALVAQPQVVEAAVYTESGEVFARYTRQGAPENTLPNSPPPEGIYFRDDALHVVRPILLDGEPVGTLYIRSGLENLNALLVRAISIALGVLASCLLIAFAMGRFLERAIAVPILSLVRAARGYSVEGALQLRAQKYGQDELGELVDAFNEMLARIQRDTDLELHSNRLEDEVTRREALNVELQDAKTRAEAAAKSKSDFLANMSHEIRTPMTAILGYIDLLADPESSSQDRGNYYDTIRRNGRHLLTIINDILDLSKVEAGQLMVERLRCSPLEIVSDAARLMRQRAEEKGLAFQVAWRGAVPERITTDPTRLRQILVNLLGNAIKFTERGHVTLRVGMAEGEPEASIADVPLLQFDVVDTGIGLREAEQARVFDAFQQADTSTTRKFGGTGLGLAISKRLAEALGGTITIRSVFGHGCTFSLTIDPGSLGGVPMIEDPSSAEAVVEVADEPAPELQRLAGRVLVAEDGPDNQRLIRAFLTLAGLEVQVVENGRLALEAALAARDAGRPFDVIVMDMQMPEMDGYEATRRLRAAAYDRPVIALTAQAMKGTREGCLDAGCDDYTTKPIDRAALLALIGEQMERLHRDARRSRTGDVAALALARAEAAAEAAPAEARVEEVAAVALGALEPAVAEPDVVPQVEETPERVVSRVGLFRFVRDLSIRQKLRTLSMASSVVSLIAATLALVISDRVHQRTLMEDRLSIVAEVAALNAVSALAYDDPDAAEHTLATLRAENDVVEAVVFTSMGAFFSRYARADVGEEELPTVVPPTEDQFDERYLHIVRDIESRGQRLGMLYVRSDLTQLNEVLVRNLSIASVVLLVCLLLAYILGTSLERMISRPIFSLVKAARGFSIENNVFVRAEKGGGQDELGELVDAFNEMVGRIESDIGLEQRRERLEEEVARRAALNNELQTETERAEAATKSKTDFLANMSHEIRTPMTAILGYIDLLADPDQSAIDAASCYETIRRNGRHLLSIINDILDLSKVEAGQLVVESLRCSPVEIVGDVAALMRQRAESKGLRFEVEWGGGIAREIETDPTRLRQVLMNLVGNAVKFTSQGSVVLRGSMFEGEAGRSGFRFDVIDSGVGLKPEEIARVFDPFQQADTSTTRKFGGTGLGLAISKRLTEALGGSIGVTSVYGQGTTFSVTIDAGNLQGVELVQHPALSSTAAPVSEPAPQGTREQLSGRVLVAEDGPDNQRLIRAFLTRVGLSVQIAENGRQALDAALAAWGAGEPFDVILMDMQMPEMDGYEATRRLRDEGYTGPVIALTAQAMKGTREGCLAAGCDDYTTKPIQRDKLVSLVRDLIAKRSQS